MILFFTSPIGLGHASRDIAIAQQLKLPERTLFVSGYAASTLIQKSGYRSLDLYNPHGFTVKSGQLHRSLRWLIRYISYYKRCKSIAKEIIIKNKDIVISDEDFASIAVAEREKRRRILITDITETHFTSGPLSLIEKSMNRAMQKMIEKCDHVIIPDFGENKNNLVFVGPIVRSPSENRDDLRKRFGFNKKTILVSVGGTDAGKFLIKRAVEAYEKIRKRLDIEMVIASGPSIKKLPVINKNFFRDIGFVPNLHEYIFAADLVISLAGRSTMDESIVYGTPGIFIPIKNHFEQEHGALRLGFTYDDIHRLEDLVEEKLLQKKPPVFSNGAENAAKIIKRLL